MTMHAMILHLFGLLLLQSADANIMVEVNPAQIDTGLSASLDVNCTFTYDGISNMDSILSMILSKDGNQTYIELATITVFAGHTINLLVQDGATADGFVNQGGESYLHLHWDNPTLQQAGLYKCSVEGLDALGHNKALHIITQVTDKQPDIVDVVSEVSAIREYVKDLESKYSALNHYTHTLEQKMFAMDAYTTVLEQKVSALENERLNRMSDLFEPPSSSTTIANTTSPRRSSTTLKPP